MKKKKYEKPSVEVVVMKQQPTLLFGSATGDVNVGIDETPWVEEEIPMP